MAALKVIEKAWQIAGSDVLDNIWGPSRSDACFDSSVRRVSYLGATVGFKVEKHMITIIPYLESAKKHPVVEKITLGGGYDTVFPGSVMVRFL